jgi:uncharacterized DUF497 family protein
VLDDGAMIGFDPLQDVDFEILLAAIVAFETGNLLDEQHFSEQAATAFFDPFFRLVDASRNDEAREAIIGYDAASRLLFVVHVELNGEAIRLISARLATSEERRLYEHS